MATYYIPSEAGWDDDSGWPQKLRLCIEQTYNSSTNTSSLSVYVELKKAVSQESFWSVISGVENSIKFTINGTETTIASSSSFSGKGFLVSGGDTWVRLRDNNYNIVPAFTCSVPHNAQGTASVPIRVKLSISANGSGRTWRDDPHGVGTLTLNNTPTYTLSISKGTGANVSVTRNGTALANGSTISRGDVLRIEIWASDGYTLGTHTVNGTNWTSGNHTVTGAVTVQATASQAASTIASASSSVATQSAFALTMTRYNSAYYHKASFKIGSTVLATSSAFATTLSYTVPRSWFNGYPTSTSLTVTVSVQTYTNSSCTTAVGSPVTTTLTVTADGDMKPTIGTGFAAAAPNNTGTAAASINGYVQGYSKATVTLTKNKLTMANGATVTKYEVTCLGVTKTVNSPGATSSVTTELLAGTSAITITVKVTDSRGRTASTTLSVTPMAYTKPTISGVSVFRCNSGGAADEGGAYFSAKATAGCSSLNGQNSVTLTAKYKAAGGSSYSSAYTLTSGTARVIGGSLSENVTYVVQLTVTDSLGNTATVTKTISTRKWAMKFRPDGEGVAFGKAPERAKEFEIPADWAFVWGTKKIRDAMNLGEADGIVEDGGSADAYTTPGVYQIISSYTITGLPVSGVAGTLRVWLSNGQAPRADGKWFFVLQAFIDIDGNEWRRRGNSGNTSTITWQAWRQLQFV